MGESVVFKPGEAHKFWNAGDGDLECLGYIEPPDNIEYFLTQLFDSTKAQRRQGAQHVRGRELIRRYRSEFVMLEIPGVDSVSCSRFPSRSALCWANTAGTPTPPGPSDVRIADRRQRADPNAHTFFTRSASKAGMPVRAMRRRRSSRNPGWAHAWAGVVISVIRAAGPR